MYIYFFGRFAFTKVTSIKYKKQCIHVNIICIICFYSLISTELVIFKLSMRLKVSIIYNILVFKLLLPFILTWSTINGKQ